MVKYIICFACGFWFGIMIASILMIARKEDERERAEIEAGRGLDECRKYRQEL